MQFNTGEFLRLTQIWLHKWLSIFCHFSQNSQFLQKCLNIAKSHVFSGITLLYTFSFLGFLLFFAKFAIFQIACKHWHVARYLLSKRRAKKNNNNSTAYFKVTSFFCSSFYFIFLFVLCLQICKFDDGKQYFFMLSTVAFHGCFLSFWSFFFVVVVLYFPPCFLFV